MGRKKGRCLLITKELITRSYLGYAQVDDVEKEDNDMK